MDSNCLLVTSFEFSKHYIRSFLQILYHSITAKVVAINIQASEAVIQDVFLYHVSITSETHEIYYVTGNQYTTFFYFLKSI